MNLKQHHNGVIEVEISRRNLKTLLAKLDGFPAGSRCTLTKETDAGLFVLRAVEDTEAYKDAPPGKVHPETEKEIA